MAKAKILKGRYLRAINKSCRKELYKKLQCLRRFGMSMVQAILFQTTNSGHKVPPFLISTVSPAIATSSREYLPKELSKMHMQTLLGTRTGNGLWQGSSHWAQAQDTAAIWSTYLWMCRRLQYVSRKYEASSSSYFHSKLWIWIVGCLGSCWVRAMYFTDHAGKIVHSLKPSYRRKGLPQSGNTGKVGKVGKVFSAHHSSLFVSESKCGVQILRSQLFSWSGHLRICHHLVKQSWKVAIQRSGRWELKGPWFQFGFQ